ncbi:MAG: energy-coupling factor transporter transmembrane component T family protein [Tumebacillaceae bacterium]
MFERTELAEHSNRANRLVERVNPSVKLILHIVCMMLMVFAPDPQTTLYLMLIPIVTTLLLSNVSLKTFLVRFSPFLIVCVSTVWMLGAWGKGETVLWHGAWYTVTQEGLTNGLKIGLRMLGFVSYGILFTLTTDVTQLVFSLMQQCKVPPKLAYALLAGLRFLPMFKEEFEQIKSAHRLRGVSRVPGIRGRVEGFLRYTIPLLAQAIRKAERVAVALEARGFDGSWNRTFYHQLKVGRTDVLYIVLLFGLQVVVFGLVFAHVL